ncbi:5824_t:CDS:2, partial [Cetraspora pellucida]
EYPPEDGYENNTQLKNDSVKNTRKSPEGFRKKHRNSKKVVGRSWPEKLRISRQKNSKKDARKTPQESLQRTP